LPPKLNLPKFIEKRLQTQTAAKFTRQRRKRGLKYMTIYRSCGKFCLQITAANANGATL